MTRARGFTLIEILVALAIIAVALAAGMRGRAAQAGAQFLWSEVVTTTPNPAFRKIEISVMEPDRPEYQVAHLVGFIGNAQPQ
jgi:prepilin-type N-terminal cleavage/methylation domain-containing protein